MFDEGRINHSAALVVLLAELLKLTISLGCFLFPATRSREAWDGAVAAVNDVVTSGSCLRFGIPAVVYMLENHIRFAVLKVRPHADCSHRPWHWQTRAHGGRAAGELVRKKLTSCGDSGVTVMLRRPRPTVCLGKLRLSGSPRSREISAKVGVDSALRNMV